MWSPWQTFRFAPLLCKIKDHQSPREPDSVFRRIVQSEHGTILLASHTVYARRQLLFGLADGSQSMRGCPKEPLRLAQLSLRSRQLSSTWQLTLLLDAVNWHSASPSSLPLVPIGLPGIHKANADVHSLRSAPVGGRLVQFSRCSSFHNYLIFH